MHLWYIGNTSVRSAMRLRDGLVALAASPLQGNLRGKDGDLAFRNLLGERGIVSLGDDDTYSVGRKWRSALNKLGFLYPKVESGSGLTQAEVGPMDSITPNGRRLINSESVPAMQECFLRALAAQYIEIAKPDGEVILFSPLKHTLKVLLKLEAVTGEASASFIEMALFIQTTTSQDSIDQLAEDIASFRKERRAAESVKRFDSGHYDRAAEALKKTGQTFRDYADCNQRYLKATGLIQSKGRGIILIPEKRLFAELLADDQTVPRTELERYTVLCNGAALPTDERGAALEVLNDLRRKAGAMGIAFEAAERPPGGPADIAVLRHELEDLIFKRKEILYAGQQAGQWLEICEYMDLIAARGERRKFEDFEICVPRTEAPAYLEWVLWRAFLALGQLANKPYEARRFKIDQDFLPVGTAPGNGPDLIMEFSDFVIAVEVTLTESSRQEAVEGEPVRRHVADLMMRYADRNKPVYGLFIANRIDSNTAETFRIGAWYTKDDQRLSLTIVPMTLSQFRCFLKAHFEAGRASPEAVRRLLIKCAEYRPACEGPEWKRNIDQTVTEAVSTACPSFKNMLLF
ncbi:AlwI family type II restriction endonuclease [Deltaproteobacteria bacterium Smac51]|nr:AlwI family type II restriction endonuclease [Deltaproteobacteria bacterium Smac51]